jgi:hypothetical protein
MTPTEKTLESGWRSRIRPWLQFRLRSVFVLFVLISIALAFGGVRLYRNYQRAAAVQFLTKVGVLMVPDRKSRSLRVYVAGPKITDSTVLELARRFQFYPELRELDIVHAPISDVGLLEVRHLTQLEVLFVHECLVTDAGIRQLKNRFPTLTIHQNAPDPVATRLAMRKVFRHAVIAAAISPDGQEIATGSGDGTLRKWRDVRKVVDTFRAHENWLFSLQYSSDGRIIATGGGDNRIRLWDAKSLAMIAELVGHTDDVHAVAFGSDGTLVSAGDDRTVRVWDIASRRERFVLSGHTAAIPTVKVSAKLGLIASGSRDRTIRLWSLETGELLHELHGHQGDVNALTLDDSETRLASASYDGTVKVWDLQQGRELATLVGHTGRVYTTAFLNELAPGYLASAGEDSTLRIWDSRSGALKGVVRTPRLIASLTAMPHWRSIIATTTEGTLDAWSPSGGELLSSHSTWVPDSLELAISN